MQPSETINPKDDSNHDSNHETVDQSPAEVTNNQIADNPWKYSTENTNESSPILTSIKPVSWTASEFVEHEKNFSWYVILAGFSMAAIAVIFLITRDWVTVVVIAMAAALFGVTAKRKPRTLSYELDQKGVKIGDKPYPYHGFKSFSVLEEGVFSSIQLMPLKRFMPPISLYYPPESEDQIISTLANYLPHEERSHDPIDKLMRKVRF